jgi:hypothetical protein
VCSGMKIFSALSVAVLICYCQTIFIYLYMFRTLEISYYLSLSHFFYISPCLSLTFPLISYFKFYSSSQVLYDQNVGQHRHTRKAKSHFVKGIARKVQRSPTSCVPPLIPVYLHLSPPSLSLSSLFISLMLSASLPGLLPSITPSSSSSILLVTHIHISLTPSLPGHPCMARPSEKEGQDRAPM